MRERGRGGIKDRDTKRLRVRRNGRGGGGEIVGKEMTMVLFFLAGNLAQ